MKSILCTVSCYNIYIMTDGDKCYGEKNKAGKRRWRDVKFKIEQLEKTWLRRVFEQRSEEYEEGSHAGVWEKSMSSREKSRCIDLVDSMSDMFKQPWVGGVWLDWR